MLFDAKAAIFPALDERSSSGKFGRIMQRIGDYVLAANLLLRPLYVPSGDMQADGPSQVSNDFLYDDVCFAHNGPASPSDNLISQNNVGRARQFFTIVGLTLGF